MAKNMQPIAKRCRALGLSPAVMGYSKKTSNRNPGGKMRRKKSECSMQLTEKQKVKFIYGILEKQFRAYYEKAEKAEGKTGEALLSLVERRLDNVVFRLGLAATRREARQLVTHSHFTVNGKKANIPSMMVKVGDVVAVKENFRDSVQCKNLAEALQTKNTAKGLDVDKNGLVAKVVAMPARDDIDFEVDEQLIVELYSK